MERLILFRKFCATLFLAYARPERNRPYWEEQDGLLKNILSLMDNKSKQPKSENSVYEIGAFGILWNKNPSLPFYRQKEDST